MIERIGRRALRAIGDVLPTSDGGVTVLAYHLIGGGTGSPVDLDAELFQSQLDQLAAHGTVVSLDEAIERLTSGSVADEHLLVLTFDDAFRNFYDRALPSLRERRLPFTLYVPTDFVDGRDAAPLAGAENLPAMTWDQVREVANSRLGTIGSHTLSHADLRSLPAVSRLIELRESRRRLEEMTEREVDSFCYPRALWSPRAERQVASVYASAVVAGGTRNRSERFRPHRISRLPIRNDMPTSLGKLLDRSVWLEEWAASQARRLAS